MRNAGCSERRRTRQSRDKRDAQTFKTILLNCPAAYVIKRNLFYISVTEIITVLKNRVISIATSSKAWVCCSLLASIAGSNPTPAGTFVSYEYCM